MKVVYNGDATCLIIRNGDINYAHVRPITVIDQ
jgi:hypothetical protein